MWVERLDRDTPCHRIEPDPAQGAEQIAKRDEMSALWTVWPKRGRGQQDGKPELAFVRGLFQAGEHAGLRQISALWLGSLAGEVPERDGDVLAKRIEHRNQPLQQRARKLRTGGNLDA